MALSYYRNPKSHNEMKFNADTEIQDLIRPKRRIKNLPNSWDDICRCDDQDTKRQVRRSQNKYRNTIRKNND
jgi:hypothetical protein